MSLLLESFADPHWHGHGIMRLLQHHKKALLWALLIALYLRFGLTLTAVGFYELYHLTQFDPLYWGYGIFKASGYYFSVWPYQGLSCLAVAVLIIGIACLRGRKRRIPETPG